MSMYFSVTVQILSYYYVVHCTESSTRLSSVQLKRRSTVGELSLKRKKNILDTVRFHSQLYNRHLYEHDCVIVDRGLCWRVKLRLLHCYMNMNSLLSVFIYLIPFLIRYGLSQQCSKKSFSKNSLGR